MRNNQEKSAEIRTRFDKNGGTEHVCNSNSVSNKKTVSDNLPIIN